MSVIRGFVLAVENWFGSDSSRTAACQFFREKSHWSLPKQGESTALNTPDVVEIRIGPIFSNLADNFILSDWKSNL